MVVWRKADRTVVQHLLLCISGKAKPLGRTMTLRLVRREDLTIAPSIAIDAGACLLPPPPKPRCYFAVYTRRNPRASATVLLTGILPANMALTLGRSILRRLAQAA